MSVFGRLYRGEIDFDFPKFYRRALVVSGVLIVISIGAFIMNGLNLSIDFEGGTVWAVPSKTLTTSEALDVLSEFDAASGAKVQEVTDAEGLRIIRLQADVKNVEEGAQITEALAKKADIDAKDVESSFVGPSWGKTVTRQAAKALVVFLVLVFVYIALTLEWRMAVGAIVALVHDIILTVGVYAIFGFEVTPATVVSFLTILGFSLYDTIVVYDRVNENGDRYGRQGRFTYETIMRRSLNQVLMRSINTTLVALLPVIAILVIGAGLYGEATLEDFGIALFVGMVSGVFSSLAIASPLVVWLKEREPQYRKIRQRIIDRGGDPNDSRWVDNVGPTAQRTMAAATVAQQSGRAAGTATERLRSRAAQYERSHPPRPRKGSKR
jgi:preprotein translocase subunit SecF